MCGIAGILSRETPADLSHVQLMTDEMQRRGPDAQGVAQFGPVILGHRRLAIIDLSPGGAQPMQDHSGRFAITFNGEIYNFQELRAQLERSGAQFRSKSDTEVILEAYKAWGPKCVEHFNGMFAFALWDHEKQSLFLARDRLGKKPLYYAHLPGEGFAFASEVKALLRLPQLERKIDLHALRCYLSLGYILHDQSIIASIRKLPAAHWMMLEPGSKPRIERYWDLASKFLTKRNLSLDDAAEELSLLLRDATKLRMVSDVPLGAFLSGGVDSSGIVSVMSELSPEQVHTFSIGFNERSYSELPEARAVADFLKVNHRDEIVDAAMSGNIEEISYYADEPFADNSMIPMYYLSKFTRERITVALSGDGGDEVFAGYATYLANAIHSLYRRVPQLIRSPLQDAVLALLPVSMNKVSFDFKVRGFLRASEMDSRDAHYSWRQIFTSDEQDSLCRFKVRECADPLAIFHGFFDEVTSCRPLDQAAYVDVKTWLVDDILVKADRMTMAHSLELRSPLLDYRIVEFAAGLPVDLRMRGRSQKRVLKRALQGKVPSQTLTGKKKGFNAPVAHWIDKMIEQPLNHAMQNGGIASELLDIRQVKRLLTQHRERKADNSFKLFTICNLLLWLQRNRDITV